MVGSFVYSTTLQWNIGTAVGKLLELAHLSILDKRLLLLLLLLFLLLLISLPLLLTNNIILHIILTLSLLL